MYRKYKTFIFFQPDLEKNMIMETLKKYYKIISNKTSNFHFKNFGTKVLAYPIKDFSTAIQIQVVYEGNGILINEITKQLSLNENVIRYVTLKEEN